MTSTVSRLFAAPAPWLMGVVNVTPDSFTDGGRFLAAESAVAHGRALLADGAQLLDLGGESTAPGRSPIGAAEELARIEPVVRALAGEAVLSIDTYHAATAERCLELGARIINDVSAMRADLAMVELLRRHDCPVVLMHAKDGPLPHATDRPASFTDALQGVGDFLAERVDFAVKHGIAAERLVLDPGMGRFVSLDPADSFRLLEKFELLVERFRPIPLLIGTSRKGFLGVPMADRDPLSQLTALIAAAKGARFIRTHEVRMARQFLDAWRAMGQPLRAACD
ncbi:dihydropteroate synthase [Marinimicrococcus flavescens]|uniref:Dihydropteroate synthase n=1 Tax=Marinimicrococcus flavescens TaxID=3031815 RepID=A0AAP3XQT1_9PROT|nr:dihydropteroate synthase [Marinimicrococcus flavescens]